MKTAANAFMKPQWLLLPALLHWAPAILAQNALLSNRLLVTDHIQVVEKDYPEGHYRYQGIDNLENKSPGRHDMMAIIAEAFSSGNTKTYSYDSFFDNTFPNNFSAGQGTIHVDTDSLAEQIRSIVFIEEWEFDTLSFTFSKHVKGFIPVRHTRQDFDPEQQKLELTALFRQAENLSRKEMRQIRKRLVPVKDIAYEFVLSEPHLLYIRGAEESVLRELGHTAFKYYNINWDRHASNTLVEGIIDQSFKDQQNVYTLDGKATYNFDSLPYIVDPYIDDLLENVIDEYHLTQSVPSMSEIKYDLKRNVFSVIFFERWSIDPETLYIDKRVNAIAPVLWQRRRSIEGQPFDDPDTGLPVYYKSILFRIPFN